MHRTGGTLRRARVARVYSPTAVIFNTFNTLRRVYIYIYIFLCVVYIMCIYRLRCLFVSKVNIGGTRTRAAESHDAKTGAKTNDVPHRRYIYCGYSRIFFHPLPSSCTTRATVVVRSSWSIGRTDSTSYTCTCIAVYIVIPLCINISHASYIII